MLGVGPAPVVGRRRGARSGSPPGIASTLLSAVFAATVEGSYLGRMSSIVRLGDDVLMPAGDGRLRCAGATVATIPVAFAVYGGAMALLMAWPLSNPALRAIRLRPD